MKRPVAASTQPSGDLKKRPSSRNSPLLADLLCSSLQHYEIIHSEKPMPKFYALEPTHTKHQDLATAGNSLFIAVARSLIYMLKLGGKRCKFLGIEWKDDICDLYLQEILRRKLCLYWLDILARDSREIKTEYSR